MPRSYWMEARSAAERSTVVRTQRSSSRLPVASSNQNVPNSYPKAPVCTLPKGAGPLVHPPVVVFQAGSPVGSLKVYSQVEAGERNTSAFTRGAVVAVRVKNQGRVVICFIRH